MVGGVTNVGDPISSVEIYDPASGTWSTTSPLPEERGLHSATLLQNGMVLVAGGFSLTGRLSRADLYDPASGTWSPTGALPVAVFLHAATLLPNGAVLATGGTVGADVPFPRPRKFTTQEMEPGPPPAASMLDAVITPPSCSAKARCW